MPVEPCGVARGLLSQFDCPLRLAVKLQHGGGKVARRAVPDQPVMLKHAAGGHMGLLNARGMELARIGPNTPDPPGGKILRDARGRVIGFGGRLLGDGKPKYLNSPETPVFHKGRELYGLYEARQADAHPARLLVVEGYMDVIALAQFGITGCVATLGTATTADHLEKLHRATPEVVFCFDGDRAGRDAAWKALQVTLPLIAPAILAGFLLSFTFSFDDFIIAFFVAGSETTLPIYVFSSIRRGVTFSLFGKCTVTSAATKTKKANMAEHP